ncbi:uncharacterized protein LOC143809441 [Ranitomeya variabilis]|uniref:uncharacterized protein LOC143809441 n=1 Tax=Ranitomeya variabilis TaxID=490064 RepID=UPI0040567B2D
MELSGTLFIFSLLGLVLQIGAVEEGVVVTQPENVTAEVGKSVTITCSFTSKFTAYSVTWSIGCNSTQNLQDSPCYQHRVNISFPDAVQIPQSSQVPTYEGKTTITINNLMETDSGRFCCHIRSGRKTGTGTGTRLEITPSSFSADRVCRHKVFLPVEILRIICLIILITLLGIVVKKSC